MQFTADQQQTIEARNPHLLVSAAAGSGKTAVMVERIVSLLCNERLHIDRMLIVTFTKAAASELRQRLESRMLQCCEQFPFLKDEVDALQNAQISTIHSYCSNVIKRNFQYCEIDPLFQTAQKRESDTLLTASITQTLDILYETAQDHPNAKTLINTFDQNSLTAMLQSLFAFALSRPNPRDYLEMQKTSPIDVETFAHSEMASLLCDETKAYLAHAQDVIQEQYAQSEKPNFVASYLKNIDSDAEQFHMLTAASQKGLLVLLEVLKEVSFSRLSTPRNLPPEQLQMKQWYQENRELLKQCIKKLKELLPEDLSQDIAEMNSMLPCVHALCDTTLTLHDAFTQNKREANVLDFNDLEHLAHHVLQNESLRKNESALFDAIFVDEYQDVSALQEAILNALKRDDQNPFYFYVGDVKQSIYRFRQADPTLFLQKMLKYQSADDAPERKMVLNRNFRSRTSVLSAVNRVFSLHMDASVTEINYDDQAALYPGLPTTFDPITELHIVNAAGKKSADLPALEAEILANDILKTVGTTTYDIDGAPNGVLRYRDIVILMPKVKKVSQVVEDVLKQHGIPVYNESQTDSYQTDEVVQLYQFLSLLCNFHNDIAMVSVLRSPLFEMTNHQLAEIRKESPDKTTSFCMAVENYAQSGSSLPLQAHCEQVFSYLENERFLLQSMALSDYIWHFLEDSGLYAHYATQPNGKHRQANLRMICHKAMDYESYAIDGLQGFLQTISEDATVSDGNAPATINPWEDVVRIMSIHKSKGLEFPTVYVMSLADRLLRKQETSVLSMDDTLGLSIRYQNPTLRTYRNTLLQKMIDFKRKNKDVSERLRLLYVALTRPKNRLVMIGSVDEKQYNYEMARDLQMENAPLRKNPLRTKGATTYLHWLIQSVSPQDKLISPDQIASTIPQWMNCGKSDFSTQSTSFPPKSTPWRVLFHNPLSTKKFSTSKRIKNLPLFPSLPSAHETSMISTFETPVQEVHADPLLPFMTFPQVPLKLGVSALVRSMEQMPHVSMPEDSTETPVEKRLPYHPTVSKRIETTCEKPAFMTLEKEDLGITLGTYTHLLLSEMPLSLLQSSKNSETAYRRILQDCLQQQVALGKIDPAATSLIKLMPIIRFLKSDLGQQMLASSTIKREYAFTLQIKQPMETILQGVIDLCFLVENQWVLIDFKTDQLKDPQALLSRYEKQLQFYRLALQTLTPYPVKTCGLYALSTGMWIECIES